LPWSEEKAIEMLTSLRWDLLRRFIEAAAANEHAMLAREEELLTGN
jgi:hypothetical protein